MTYFMRCGYIYLSYRIMKRGHREPAKGDKKWLRYKNHKAMVYMTVTVI